MKMGSVPGTVPVIAVTSGEPAGIGPELCLRLADRPAQGDSTQTAARIVVLGDLAMLAERARRLNSSVRLRDWMGVDEATFYDRERMAIVPMAFCFPGYDGKGADLPPPPICARTWRARVMAELAPRLILLVGGHAQRWHLGTASGAGVTARVRAWRDNAPRIFPLPHPSWRNTGWLRRNPWFQDELLPALRAAVADLLREPDDPAG